MRESRRTYRTLKGIFLGLRAQGLSSRGFCAVPFNNGIGVDANRALFLAVGHRRVGGPAAHNAMMDEEFVRRRGWVSRADFLDMLRASNLVRGPSSTEMAIHIGHQRGGWKGSVVGGACFILPAMLIVMLCA